MSMPPPPAATPSAGVSVSIPPELLPFVAFQRMKRWTDRSEHGAEHKSSALHMCVTVSFFQCSRIAR